jgi:hypothetical protein
MLGARQRHAGLWPSLLPKAAGTNSDQEAGLTARLSASRPPLSLLEGGGVSRRLALASQRLRTRRVLVENMRGEWQRGAMLADASMPPKATETNKNKEADLPARPPTRRILVTVGKGRRGPSAGAGRRSAATNPLRLGARAGRSGELAAWGPALALSNGVTPRVLHLTGSGRLWMERKRLLFLRCGGQLGRRGRRS